MKNNTLLKGTALLIICNLIGKILGAVYRIPLAKILGPVGIGMYQLVFPLYCLILTISTSGMPIAISKLVAEYNSRDEKLNSRKILKISFLILTIVSFVGSLLVIVGARFISIAQGNIDIYICYYAIAPAILFVGMLSALRGYFQGNLLMFPTAISSLIEQVVKMIVGLFLAGKLLEFGVEYAVLGAIVGISISELFAVLFLIVCYLFVKGKKIKNENQKSLGFKVLTKEIFSLAMPVTMGGLIAPITSMVDSLLVINILMWTGFSNVYSTTLLGLQSGIVEPLVNIPVIISISIATVVLPNISKHMAENAKEKANGVIENAFQLSLSISLACAICFVIFGRQILSFLYGSSFAEGELYIATKLLFLGSLNIIFLSLVQVSASVLQGLGYSKIPVKSLLIGCAIKIVLDVVLISIKNINIYGSIIAGAVCYVVVFIINYSKIKKITQIKLNNSVFYLSIQACFVCLFAYASNVLFGLVFSEFISMFVAGIITVAVFFVTYYIFFICDNNTPKFQEKNF